MVGDGKGARGERSQDSIDVISKGTVDLFFHFIEVTIAFLAIIFAALAIIFAGVEVFMAVISVLGAVLGSISVLEITRLFLFKFDKYIVYPLQHYRMKVLSSTGLEEVAQNEDQDEANETGNAEQGGEAERERETV